jgi:hypothetical protein
MVVITSTTGKISHPAAHMVGGLLPVRILRPVRGVTRLRKDPDAEGSAIADAIPPARRRHLTAFSAYRVASLLQGSPAHEGCGASAAACRAGGPCSANPRRLVRHGVALVHELARQEDARETAVSMKDRPPGWR